MSDDKNIVLINLKPPYELKPSTMRMAAAARCMTKSVQQVLVASETDVLLIDLLAQEYAGEEEAEQQEPTKLEMTQTTFADIFAAAHTVILPDSMFVEKSRVFHFTAAFGQHGVPALAQYYQTGGTVLVQCVEGALSSACTAVMNNTFGTNWKMHVLADSITLGPTDTARRLFDTPHLPERVVWENSAFFLSCPADEGLYQVLLPTKEEFEKSFQAQDEMFERLGIVPDDKMDCFDVEKSWKDYVAKYSDRYGLALHVNVSGGQVIWYGDRSQTNRTMTFIFCKLLTLARVLEDAAAAHDDDDDFYHQKRKQALYEKPNAMMFMAVVVVVAAVGAKVLGY